MAYQMELTRFFADKLLGKREDISELSRMLEDDARRYIHSLNDENEAKTR